MSEAALRRRADQAFESRVASNPYPGRGLVLGRDAAGEWIQIYWIMGRSANSRNRRFVAEAGELRTEPVDLAAVRDPSLIIYRAMRELPGRYLVGNGDQTDTLYDALERGESFERALSSREREPDAPNYTPRISGLIDLRAGEGRIALSLLRANPADPERTDRFTFCPAPPPAGLGLALTTYEGDGDPLPSFRGEPLWFPTDDEPKRLAERYWSALDAANRVALAVKRIPADGAPSELWLHNRHEG